MEIRVNPLSLESVTNARKQLQKYKRSLPRKCRLLASRLAELGRGQAEITFSTAVYDINVDGTPMNPANIVVTVEDDSENEKGQHFTIHADGHAVAFVEFGAGVYYNGIGGGKHPYRPEGIVGIGEYGKGKGKQEAWGFKDEFGASLVTRGTPAQPGMWMAALTMREQITEIAKEVFAS
jgi:hypothetical protein